MLCLSKANYIQSTHTTVHPICMPSISESLRHLYVSLKLIFRNRIFEGIKCFETCCDKLRIKRTEYTACTHTHTHSILWTSPLPRFHTQFHIAPGIATVSNDKWHAMNEWACEHVIIFEKKTTDQWKEWNKSTEKSAPNENSNSNKGYTNFSGMEMTVSVRQFYTHSVEFTIIHVGRSNVCNFNIHHHLLIRFVTPPTDTHRSFSLALTHTLCLSAVWWILILYKR